jgi:hypothetical protein
LALLVDEFFGWGQGTEERSLSSEQSQTLVTFFHLVTKRPGEVLFDVDAESEDFFFVVAGEVALYVYPPNLDLICSASLLGSFGSANLVGICLLPVVASGAGDLYAFFLWG